MAESINQSSNQNLQYYVNQLLDLANSESLPEEDLKTVKTSCKQAISHTFEIAFAGLRSAGKSTTINALLERELLYSQASHATGTVCYIRSLSPSDTEENIKITFINQSQFKSEIAELCQDSGISNSGDITQLDVRKNLQREIRLKNIDQELPGKVAQSVKLLGRLLEAYEKYQDYITEGNNVLPLSPINEKTLTMAGEYAAWENAGGEVGGGSVVQRIDYYCKNPLLDSGNILIDLPGIDAPIKRDRDLTQNRLIDDQTGAVIFMPSSAYEGDLSQEEIDINSLIKDNLGIRSRVFFVFNRVDETWFDSQKRNKFSQNLDRNFSFLNEDNEDETKRIYATSALLGLYSNLIQEYININGSTSLSIPNNIQDGIEIGNNHIPSQYLISLANFFRFKKNISFGATDTENNDVLAKDIKEIINNYASSLEDVISESGIPRLQQSLRDYVNLKKRPQLYQQLNEDLQSLCRQLREKYRKQLDYLEKSPKTTEELKVNAKKEIDKALKSISEDFEKHIIQVQRDFSTSTEVWADLKKEFETLKEDTTQFLENIVDRSDFSLNKLYKNAANNRIGNKETAPIISSSYYS